jgi:hypothetical protein
MVIGQPEVVTAVTVGVDVDLSVNPAGPPNAAHIFSRVPRGSVADNMTTETRKVLRISTNRISSVLV